MNIDAGGRDCRPPSSSSWLATVEAWRVYRRHGLANAFGRKLQVKARLVSQRATPGQLQTSAFRSWTFDFAVLV